MRESRRPRIQVGDGKLDLEEDSGDAGGRSERAKRKQGKRLACSSEAILDEHGRTFVSCSHP